MTKGGHCLVAWPKVCLPKELGGLGISNLQNLSWALRMRWLWLKKTDPNRPWHMFHIPVHNCVQAFFSVAVISVVGNGAATLFSTDRWIDGQSIADLASHVLAFPAEKKDENCFRGSYRSFMGLRHTGCHASCFLFRLSSSLGPHL